MVRATTANPVIIRKPLCPQISHLKLRKMRLALKPYEQISPDYELILRKEYLAVRGRNVRNELRYKTDSQTADRGSLSAG
jgi:hypothetical protein